MSELPITQKQFDGSVMIANFLTEIRENYEEHCIKFTPLTDGYDIALPSGIGVISIRKPKRFSKYFIIRVRIGSKTKKYKFKEKTEIKSIVQKIIAEIRYVKK